MNDSSLPAQPLAFIWYFLKRYPISLMVFALTSILWALDLCLGPYLLKLIIDGANKTADHPNQLMAVILIPAVLYASLSLVMNFTFRIYRLVCRHLFPKLKVRITSVAFDYLSHHSYRFFQDSMSGVLTRKVLDLAECVEPLIQLPNENFIPRALAATIATAMLCLVAPMFAIYLVAWLVVFMVVTTLFMRWVNVASLAMAGAYTRLSGTLSDSVTNVVTSKLFAREQYELQRVQDSLDYIATQDRELQRRFLISNFFMGLLITALISGMLWMLISARKNNLVTVGDFAFVLSLSMSISYQIWDIAQQMILFTKTLGKYRQALTVITEPHETPDVANASTINISEGKVEFRDVNFCYVDDNNTLKNLSVTIKPGEKVGLVGFSGGGKSTFVKLLLRLFEINSGKILIDDHDISQVTKASLRSQIAIVPQDPELFHRSISDNIRYGNPTASDDEVILAAKAAHCHEFIERLPEGYDSLVGEKGVKLSGGQKQRIAIARAIIKHSHLLIFDEATSALDSDTERYIQESLHTMMQGKTTIVIAHRLSTLLEMDRILFFKDGEIVEEGSFAQLRSSNGYFAKLWDKQSDGYMPNLEADELISIIA